MTGIHNSRPNFLDKVVLPAPARPVMMMHFGFLSMFPDVQLYDQKCNTSRSGHFPTVILKQNLKTPRSSLLTQILDILLTLFSNKSLIPRKIMIHQRYIRRFAAVAALFIFTFSNIAVQAHPLLQNSPFFEDTPLPPVNWIRSRTIDVKDLNIDLKFDWDKEQAIGSEVVTFAPFNNSDTFSLDAAMMTIDSVKLVNGTPLKFAYDDKKDNDNLV